MRVLVVAITLIAMVFISGIYHAQTETPTPSATPTATHTPTPEPYVYATLPAPDEGASGQMSRFDYVATAGDVHIANLLTLILLSLWGFFLFDFFFRGRN